MVAGGCLCGVVRFEVDEPFVSAGYCHCTRCQRRTGALRVVSGEQLVRCFDPGDGGFLKCFCSACGGALWSRHPEDPGVVSVRLGAVDSDPGIRPSYRQFVAYAASWEEIPDDGLPRFPEARAA